MSEGGAKRRLHIRRKRTIGSDIADEGVLQFGCCLIEVVAAASMFIGLLAVPTLLMA